MKNIIYLSIYLSILVLFAALFDSCSLQAANLTNVSNQQTCTVLHDNAPESQTILVRLENKLETDYGLIIQELEKGINSNPYTIAIQLNLPLQSYVYYLFKRKYPTAPIDAFSEFLKVNQSAFPDFSVEVFENYLPSNKPSMGIVERIRAIGGSACKGAYMGMQGYALLGVLQEGPNVFNRLQERDAQFGFASAAFLGGLAGTGKELYRQLPRGENSLMSRFTNWVKSKWYGKLQQDEK